MMSRTRHRSPHTQGLVGQLPPEHRAVEQRALHIRLRLQELGPPYSCLALYLSSRIDFLPAAYCHEFGQVADCSPALSPAQVRDQFENHLGLQFQRAFTEFDFSPFQTTLIGQWHHALLRTGASVAVLLLHPSFYALQQKSETSPLDMDQVHALCGDLLSPDAIPDFLCALRRKTDLRLAGEALQLMARDTDSFELLYSTEIYAELSNGKVLTVQQREEEPLETIVREPRHSPELTARRLCHLWLRQLSQGRCFPVDLRINNVFLDNENRLSFHGCEFAQLSSASRDNLSNYLVALMSDDPDKAAVYLLREMTPQSSARKIDSGTFRANFRQAAYFGMLEPILGTNTNTLAQIAFQHWKTALDHGFVHQPQLLCFYRGLFSVARIARQLSPSCDVLREALEELHSGQVYDQIREILDWRYWWEHTDKFASAMVHLPKSFDEALTRSSAPLADSVQGNSNRHRSFLVTLTILLVLFLLILQLPAGPGWQGKIIPLMLMLAGLLVLFATPD